MKKKTRIKRFLSILLTAVMVASLFAAAPVSVFAAADDIVKINDENLRKAICTALGKSYSTGVEITQAEMESLTELKAENAGITNITGLETAVNLVTLDLGGNDFSGSSAMSSINSLFAPYKSVNGVTAYYVRFSQLKYLDLSNCNFGGEAGKTNTMKSTFDLLPALETLDLSDNNLYGTAYLGAAANYYIPSKYNNLKTADFSGNNFGGFQISRSASFESLERVDLSGNRIWLDEASIVDNISWYASILELGFDMAKADLSDQKSLTELGGVYLDGDSSFRQHNEMIDNTDKVIDLGNTLDDSIDFALGYYGNFGDLSAVLGNQELPKMIDSVIATPKTNIERTKFTWDNLKQGENTIQLKLNHAGGSGEIYTVKVFYNNGFSNVGEDSAGITDSVLQKEVCRLLGKDAATYTVTKADMALLKGTLTVSGIEDAEGVQYATAITGLNLSGDNLVKIPDLSTCTSLTSLYLKGPYTDVRGIEDLTKLTALSLTSNDTAISYTLAYTFASPGKLQTALDLSKLTALKEVTIVSSELTTAPVIGSETINALYISFAKDGTYPDLTGKTIGRILTIDNTQNDAYKAYINSAANIKASAEIQLINITNDLNLNDLQAAKLLIAADCSSKDVKVDITGLKNSSGKLILTLAQYGEHTFYLKGNSDAVTELDNKQGNYIYEEGLSMPELTKITFRTDCKLKAPLPASFSSFDKLTDFVMWTSVLPDGIFPTNFNNAPELKTFSITKAGGLQFDPAVDFSQSIKMTSFTLSYCEELLLDGSKLPRSLTSLSMPGNTLNSLNDFDVSNLQNLTTLDISYGGLEEFPVKMIQNLPNLKNLAAYANFYPDIPEDTFDNSPNLEKVSIGSWLKVVSTDEGIVPAEGTETSKAIKGLKTNCPNVSVAIHSSNEGGYCNLIDLYTDSGEIRGDVFTETNLSLFVVPGTEEVVLTPKALFSDTVITVGDKEYKSGDEIVLSLSSSSQTFKIKTENTFTNFIKLPTEKTYNLTIVQGEVMEEFIPQDGGVYSVNSTMLKHNTSVSSMADNYMSSKATIRYNANAENGKQFDVRFTTTKPEWIPEMKYYDIDGNLQVAEVIEEDTVAGTRTYRIYTNDVSQPIYISPYVVPMGSYPICDLSLDLTSAVDITASAGVDKADLNAAINKALEIMDKRNVYTSESYSAMAFALEDAQDIAVLSAPIKSAVDSAAKALNDAINALVVDESKLADKTDLKAELDAAAAAEKGGHTDTVWNALQEAISDALAVYDTLEASQTEVDTARKSLNTALTLFNSSGEASELDKDNLKDGIYSISVEMVKTNRQDKSMANNAINHTAKLQVINGEYYVTLDFNGITIENRFGYLQYLSYYADGYTYNQYGGIEGNFVPGQVLGTQKDSDGNDVIDQYNDKDNLYPDLIKIKLVPTAIADQDGYVALHVFVPIMESISQGSGDQDVLMKIDWTTLKETTEDDPNFQPQEPEEQSPAVDTVDKDTGIKVHADKGVFPEGVKLVVKNLTEGSVYDRTVNALADVGKKFRLYDIYFVGSDGNKIDPNGTVTVSYPIPGGYDADNVVLYRINEDGSKTLIGGAALEGYYTVVTKSFSNYALVEKGSTVTDAQNTKNVNSVKTGDNTDTHVYFMLVLVTVGLSAAMLIVKRRKTNG